MLVESGSVSADSVQGQAVELGLSVLMPCHDESKSVRESLLKTLNALREGCDRPFEILLVDDGSADGSWEIAESLATQIPEVRVIRHKTNGGKGKALRTGFEHARGNTVCFLDCGLDIDPKHVAEFVHALEADSCQVVVGSKRHPDSKVDYPLRRRALSRVYELVVRSLFGLRIRDTQAGIKVFRREVLEAVMPMGLVKRYAFDIELLVLAHSMGFRIEEKPIEMHFREEFGSGVDARAITQMLLDTFGVFYRLKIAHRYAASESRLQAGE